jgi:hypothetical protein
MSYIPAVALLWFGPEYSRTLFIPTAVSLRLFSNGAKIPFVKPSSSNDASEATSKNANDGFSTFGQLTHFFETHPGKDSDDMLDEIFDHIGKIVGCVEEYIEFSKDQVALGSIPPGMAIVQWYTRK